MGGILRSRSTHMNYRRAKKHAGEKIDDIEEALEEVRNPGGGK